MSFADAVRSVFSKYATFSGRARRSEFWWFALFAGIVYLVAGVIDAAIGNQIVGYLVALALLLPSLAVNVRRLHDTGRSGWWMLLAIIPLIGAIVLLVFALQDSQPETNNHGPSPKPLGADPAYPTTYGGTA